MVIQYHDLYYMFYYRRGSTEYQDHGPEFDDALNGYVEGKLVFPKEKIITIYE